MATTVIYPTSDYSGNWVSNRSGEGIAPWQILAGIESGYVYGNYNPYGFCLFGTPSVSSGVINSVTVYLTLNKDASPSYGSILMGAETVNIPYVGNNVAQESYTWTVNPATGNPWQWSELANGNLWAGGQIFTTASEYAYFYALSVVIDYTQLSLPTVTTQAPSGITSTGGTGNGNVTSTGNQTITKRGFVLHEGTSVTPTVDHYDFQFEDVGSYGTGAFTKTLTGLTRATTYKIRAYCYNASGYAYGSSETFVTLAELPTVETHTPATDVTENSAYVEGHVTDEGGVAVTERGICYNTATNPTTANSKVLNGTGEGTFNTQLTMLQQGTIYHARAYAINSVGTSYGAEVDFTTNVDVNAPAPANVIVYCYKPKIRVGVNVNIASVCDVSADCFAPAISDTKTAPLAPILVTCYMPTIRLASTHAILQNPYYTVAPMIVNRVFVIGRDRLGNAVFGEWDATIPDQPEVLKIVSDPMITTEEIAQEVAENIGYRNRLNTVLASITVPPNIAQEIGDVVTVNDSTCDQTTKKYRIDSWTLTYDTRQPLGYYQQAFRLTGV